MSGRGIIRTGDGVRHVDERSEEIPRSGRAWGMGRGALGVGRVARGAE